MSDSSSNVESELKTQTISIRSKDHPPPPLIPPPSIPKTSPVMHRKNMTSTDQHTAPGENITEEQLIGPAHSKNFLPKRPIQKMEKRRISRFGYFNLKGSTPDTPPSNDNPPAFSSTKFERSTSVDIPDADVLKKRRDGEITAVPRKMSIPSVITDNFCQNSRNVERETAPELLKQISSQADMIRKLECERSAWQRKIIEIEREKRDILTKQIISPSDDADLNNLLQVQLKCKTEEYAKIVKSLEAKVQSLLIQLNEKETNILRLNDRIKSDSSNASDCENAKVKKLRCALSEKEQCLEEWRKFNVKLNDEIKKLRTEKIKLSKEMSEALQDNKQLKVKLSEDSELNEKENSNLNSTLTENCNIIQHQKQSIDCYKKQVVEMGERISLLQQSVDDINTTNQILQSKVDQQNEKMNDDERTINEMKTEISKFEQEKSNSLKNEKSKRDQLVAKNDTNRKELEDRIAKNQLQFEKAAIESKKQISYFENENARLTNQVNTLLSQFEEKDIELKATVKRMNVMNDQVTNMRTDIRNEKERSEELDKVRKKLTDTSKQLESSRKRTEATEIELKNVVSQNCDLEKQVKSKSDHLNEVETASLEHVVRLKSLEEMLEQQKTIREEAYKCYSDQTDALENQIKTLKNDVRQLSDAKTKIEDEMKKNQKNKCDEISNLHQNLSRQLNEVKTEKASVEDKLCNVEKDFLLAQSRWRSTESEMKDKLETLSKNNSLKSDSISSLERQLNESLQTIDELKEQNGASSSHQAMLYEKTLQELSEQKRINDFGCEQRLGLDEQLRKLNIEILDKNKVINELSEEKASTLEIIEKNEKQSRSELQRCRYVSEELKNANTELNRRVSSLNSTNESISSKNELLQKRMEDSNHEIKRKEGCLSKLEGKFQSLEMKLKELELDHHLVKEERNRLLVTIEDEKNKHKGRIESKDSKYTTLTFQHDKLKQDLAEKQRAFEEDKLNLCKEIETQKLSLDTLRNQLELSDKELKEKNKTMLDIEEELKRQKLKLIEASSKKKKDIMNQYKQDIADLQKSNKEMKKCRNESMTVVNEIEKDLRKILRDLGTKKAHNQLRQLVDNLCKKSSALQSKSPNTFQSCKIKECEFETNRQALEDRIAELKKLSDSDQSMYEMVHYQSKLIEILKQNDIKLDAKTCESDDAPHESNHSESIMVKKGENGRRKSEGKKCVTFVLEGEERSCEESCSDDQKVQQKIRFLEQALVEAEKERSQIIEAADDEIAHYKSIASEIQENIIDDFEWKLHNVQHSFYQELLFLKENISIQHLDDTIDSMQERISTAFVDSKTVEDLQHKVNDFVRQQQDDQYQISSLKIELDSALQIVNEKRKENETMVEKLHDATSKLDVVENVNNQHLKEINVGYKHQIDDLNERLDAALGKKLEHMLSLREEIEEEYAERMEELRNMYTDEMEKISKQSIDEKNKFAKTEANLHEALQTKRKELEDFQKRSSSSECKVRELTVRLENQTLEVLRLQSELEAYEYGGGGSTNN